MSSIRCAASKRRSTSFIACSDQDSMAIDARADAGLSSSEASSRLASQGYNELPSAKPRGLWGIAWDVVREPMFLLLIGASTVYLVLGDIREALVLVASVILVMGI